MTKPPTMHALHTVLDRAMIERDEATAALYLALETTRRLQSQRQQLVTYRTEYQARWTQQFQQLAAIEVVHSYQSFVDRLDHALEQLRSQLDSAETAAEEARQILLARETRLAAVRKVAAKRSGDAALHTARREQRHGDDMATMAAWHAAPVLVAAASR